jgi:hypothetical protein
MSGYGLRQGEGLYPVIVLTASGHSSTRLAGGYVDKTLTGFT